MVDFRSIAERAKKAGLQFILAGGHAVNVHGYARTTGDIDLVIERSSIAEWKKLLVENGYVVFQEHENFLQLSPPTESEWPIDLVLVSERTFNGMVQEGVSCEFDGISCLAASAKHLIAMKLHALSQNFKVRELKDIADILALLRAQKLTPDDESFKQLCEKYATMEVYESIRSRF